MTNDIVNVQVVEKDCSCDGLATFIGEQVLAALKPYDDLSSVRAIVSLDKVVSVLAAEVYLEE